MPTIEINKKYALNNGLIAHITAIKTDKEGSWPAAGTIHDKNGNRIFEACWTEDGFFSNENEITNFDIKNEL